MSVRMIKDVLNPKDFSTHCPLCARAFSRFPSDEEHIFPKWLQHLHDLWTKKLSVPNFTGKNYQSVKIRICKRCNGTTYHAIENELAPLIKSADPFSATANLNDDVFAVWLGKIMWLLIAKSQSAVDHRTRDWDQADSILPQDMVAGTRFLGMFDRAFATKKSMNCTFLYDPPLPTLLASPYSVYRFKIDTSDARFEQFDFSDNSAVLGVAFRSGNLGVICLFDGGLHRRFLSPTYSFLGSELLHPVQFSEIAGRMFYDQVLLHDGAHQVIYRWNGTLHSVVAQLQVPRKFNPYLAANHDDAVLAEFISRKTSADPSQILRPQGVVTTLLGPGGKFAKYLVTDEEIEAARNNPDWVVYGPLDRDWRIKEHGPSAEDRE
jgi:hypothetical protein